MRPNGFSGNGESQAETRAIPPALFTEGSKRIARALGDAAAFIFDLDEGVPVLVVRPEHHPPARGGELEGVVQEVGHRRREDLRVSGDGQWRVDRFEGELDAAILGVETARDGEVVQEGREVDALSPLLLRFLRMSDSMVLVRSRKLIRLRPSTAAVLPLMATLPRFNASNAIIAVFSRSRVSCATRPARSTSSVDRDSAVIRACSVTDSAIAVSRHRFNERNSSVVIGACCSSASSVTAWQMSP